MLLYAILKRNLPSASTMRMEVVTNSSSRRHSLSINIKQDLVQECTHTLMPAHVTLISDNPVPVSLRPPQIPQASPCGIFGGQSVFPPPQSTSVFPCKYHYSDTLYSHSITSHRRCRRQLTASINKTHLARYIHRRLHIAPLWHIEIPGSIVTALSHLGSDKILTGKTLNPNHWMLSSH